MFENIQEIGKTKRMFAESKIKYSSMFSKIISALERLEPSYFPIPPITVTSLFEY